MDSKGSVRCVSGYDTGWELVGVVVDAFERERERRGDTMAFQPAQERGKGEVDSIVVRGTAKGRVDVQDQHRAFSRGNLSRTFAVQPLSSFLTSSSNSWSKSYIAREAPAV